MAVRFRPQKIKMGSKVKKKKISLSPWPVTRPPHFHFFPGWRQIPLFFFFSLLLLPVPSLISLCTRHTDSPFLSFLSTPDPHKRPLISKWRSLLPASQSTPDDKLLSYSHTVASPLTHELAAQHHPSTDLRSVSHLYPTR
jgi:hypothetical protein